MISNIVKVTMFKEEMTRYGINTVGVSINICGECRGRMVLELGHVYNIFSMSLCGFAVHPIDDIRECFLCCRVTTVIHESEPDVIERCPTCDSEKVDDCHCYDY